MTIAPALMSSARTGTGSDTWRTPPHVLQGVRTIDDINLDPCASEDPSHWFAENNLALFQRQDGLIEGWWGLTFVNPPYSKMADWADKMAHEAGERGTRIVALVPARVDTQWWRTCVSEADVVAFYRKRLTFVGAPSTAPFPSALLAFNIGRRAMLRAFGDVADVWSCP